MSKPVHANAVMARTWPSNTAAAAPDPAIDPPGVGVKVLGLGVKNLN